MAINENGTIDTWGLEDSEMVEDEDGNINHSDASLEQYDKFFGIMSKYLQKAGYEKLEGTARTENLGFVLPDGTQIIGMWLKPSQCSGNNAYCGDFYIKTDNKPVHKDDVTDNPNIFAFKINPYRIFPFGTDNSTFKNYCLNGENYSRCTGWVIMNGNMDYLHCKDLDINTKTKCK